MTSSAPSSRVAALHRSIRTALARRRPVFFLDYDGTLTPIVERPEDAVLSEEMRTVLGRLAARFPVAVVSGRGRPDVEERVGLPGLYYAGSHGFDIAGPPGAGGTEGAGVTHQAAADAVPVVEEVTGRLERALAGFAGAQVEPKRFTVAVHYRRAAPEDVPRMEAVVDRLVAEHPGLRKAGGKKVWEIRPALDWDKGKAVEWILRVILSRGDLAPEDALAIYAGDDDTDEDAFRALRDHDPPGISILVTETPRPTAATHTLRDPDEVRALLALLAPPP
ncbi:MAG: trehalose-phosphatase [Acidobacteriota bacterium]|jgi:alpha,alpha-trehalase